MSLVNAINSLLRNALTQSERLGLKARRSRLRRTRLGRAAADLIYLPSDIGKIVSHYKVKFGTLPNVIAPTTFNEYLQQFKLLNRNSKYAERTDKLLVRDYVAKKVGSQYLNRLLWSGDDLRTVERKFLPQSFVIKANHGCGLNIIVKNKDAFDWDAAYQATNHWLSSDHSIEDGEWQYRWIAPRLLIEELLIGPDGQVPRDYKFYVFGGSVRFLQIHFDRFSNHTSNFYDETFKKLNVRCNQPNFEGAVEKPDFYEEMVAVAEALSDGERFVRVDLYDIGRPVFGELTFTPNAGLGMFYPPDFDKLLGKSYREFTK